MKNENTITGKEVRYMLRQQRVNLRKLADAMNISPQALNSRLNASTFSRVYLDEITDALGRDIFGLSEQKDFESVIPVLDLRVCAGCGIGLDGDENRVTEYVTIPSLKGCYGLTVYGDSMTPRYHSGDIVFVRPADGTAIDYGHPHLIITQTDRLLKVVYPSDDANLLRLVAINTDYPEMEITKDSVLFIYKVIGMLRREQI